MGSTFIVTSTAGPNRDHARGTRQQPLWDEHAAFVDRLVEEGFIALGGPLPDEGGAALVVRMDGKEALKDAVVAVLHRNHAWLVRYWGRWSIESFD